MSRGKRDIVYPRFMQLALRLVRATQSGLLQPFHAWMLCCVSSDCLQNNDFRDLLARPSILDASRAYLDSATASLLEERAITIGSEDRPLPPPTDDSAGDYSPWQVRYRARFVAEV